MTGARSREEAQALGLVSYAVDQLRHAQEQRDAVIVDALQRGCRVADVAAASGLTRARVYQLRAELLEGADLL